MALDAEGNIIHVGDVVFFKSDIEQYGRVTKIVKDWNVPVVHLEALHPEGFDGEYIGGDMTCVELAEDVYVNG